MEKFLTKPAKKDLTFSELETLLTGFGYEKMEGSGSRVKFFHPKTKDIISLHKPHPSNILKIYIVKEIQEKISHLKK